MELVHDSWDDMGQLNQPGKECLTTGRCALYASKLADERCCPSFKLALEHRRQWGAGWALMARQNKCIQRCHLLSALGRLWYNTVIDKTINHLMRLVVIEKRIAYSRVRLPALLITTIHVPENSHVEADYDAPGR
jgi:hypothetical protein